MTVKIVTGDLFENKVGAQALAHGVNCDGVMGAGIAADFKDRYISMWKSYQHWIAVGIQPGFAYLSWAEEVGSKMRIFCLTTQDKPGPHAKYEFVRSALKDMRKQAKNADIESIALPKIACGIGGLNTESVLKIIAEIFEDWEGTIYVYL